MGALVSRTRQKIRLGYPEFPQPTGSFVGLLIRGPYYAPTRTISSWYGICLVVVADHDHQRLFSMFRLKRRQQSLRLQFLAAVEGKKHPQKHRINRVPPKDEHTSPNFTTFVKPKWESIYINPKTARFLLTFPKKKPLFSALGLKSLRFAYKIE